MPSRPQKQCGRDRSQGNPLALSCLSLPEVVAMMSSIKAVLAPYSGER